MIFYVFLLLFSLSSCWDWHIPLGGILDPPVDDERYREAEYAFFEPDAPFFQWWYFWVKDLETNTHYALSLGMSSRAGNNSGASIMFSRLGGVGGKISRYEVFPLDELVVGQNASVLAASLGGGAVSMTLSDGGSQVRLRGTLNSTARTWISIGLPASTPISFDLTLRRRFGFYGQRDFERIDDMFGVIMWDTYAHTALVAGEVRVGGGAPHRFAFDNPRQRAYGDENWGTQFPVPPPPSGHGEKRKEEDVDDYAWGWYYAGVPAERAEDEIALIVGVGREYQGWEFGTMVGRFGALNLGDGKVPVTLVECAFWQGDGKWGQTVSGTNDGELLQADVVRSAWTNVTDEFGTALIPLEQTLIVRTTHVNLTMTFSGSFDHYLRLLFATKGYVFSDFEGLGVTAKVLLEVDGRAPVSFTTTNAGVEYGAKIPIHF